MSVKIDQRPFGGTENGEGIECFTLTSDSGVSAKVITYGATLIWLDTPDRHGRNANIVLARPDMEAYEEGTGYLGATIGRYANRIAGGSFSLGDTDYTLATNESGNHLHGGVIGFDKRVWYPRPFASEDIVGVSLAYESVDGEEGYPGNLEALTTYSLTSDGMLSIEYSCTTDRLTHVNLTNHSYFNLAGHDSGTILEHELMLDCDRFLPVDDRLIPTGEVESVEGTPMDFRRPKAVGRDITRRGDGYGELYDVCMVARSDDPALKTVAVVVDPGTGRRMEIMTTQPAIQLYTGNHFRGVRGVNGAIYERYQGLALETQHYPDSPNQPEFPSTLLKPGQEYSQKTTFRFSTDTQQ